MWLGQASDENVEYGETVGEDIGLWEDCAENAAKNPPAPSAANPIVPIPSNMPFLDSCLLDNE